MTKIIIIGTLHAGLTPNRELGNVLKNLNPDLLLVEIANDDLIKNNLAGYPEEIIFACKWAKENGIKISGFDSKINIFKNEVLPDDNAELLEEQKKLLGKFSWKDCNKKENEKLLDTKKEEMIIDKKKWKKRENEMLKNIEKNIPNNGTIVIITGVGHLDFFEKKMKNAIFPLR
jgi:hypothetical protein